MRRHVAMLLSLLLPCIAMGDAAPPDTWTQDELNWVTKTRQLYAEQGLGFTDEQAAEAVGKIREKNQVSGIPESQWTDNERKAVQNMRDIMKRQGREATDEQARLMVKKMRTVSNNMFANVGVLTAMQSGHLSVMPAPAAKQSSPQPGLATITEDELAAKLAGEAAPEPSLQVTGSRDGFSVNGRRFIDPEGYVVMYAHNVLTKDIGYLVKRQDDFVLKLLPKGNTVSEPIVIGTASWGSQGWTGSTVTGKVVRGYGLSVTPDGFVVGRDTAAFVYQAGHGLRSISIPEGYLLAPLQRGDVSGTGFLLLIKENATGEEGTTSKVTSSLKSLGAVLGMGKKEDYALMDIASGALIPMNMDAAGNEVHELSGCVKQNSLVNKCSAMRSFESLYTPTGRNEFHYFWRAAWFPTPSGPIAVSLENGVKDIYVTDLKTGKRETAFHRTLGINGYDVTQKPDGAIMIRAHWGLTDHTISDAAALLNGSVQATSEP